MQPSRSDGTGKTPDNEAGDDQASIARRRDEALRRALSMPPKPKRTRGGDASAERPKRVKRGRGAGGGNR